MTTTETPTFRPLTPLERNSVYFWMEIFADFAFDKLQAELKSAEEVSAQVLAEALVCAVQEQGPLAAKVLTALAVEHVVAGDRNSGEADPPEDVLLGPAIDEYLARALAIVKLNHPEWYKGMGLDE